jgi:hypothetical protein
MVLNGYILPPCRIRSEPLSLDRISWKGNYSLPYSSRGIGGLKDDSLYISGRTLQMLRTHRLRQQQKEPFPPTQLSEGWIIAVTLRQ